MKLKYPKKYDEPLSNLACDFNCHRPYSVGQPEKGYDDGEVLAELADITRRLASSQEDGRRLERIVGALRTLLSAGTPRRPRRASPTFRIPLHFSLRCGMCRVGHRFSDNAVTKR